MPLYLGAEGLDLIIASRVFLLEPLLNAQQEAQAINRVYRIGQQKNTVVYKYVIEGTIEQRIDGLRQKQRKHENDVVTTGNSPKKKQKDRKRDDSDLAVAELCYLLS